MIEKYGGLEAGEVSSCVAEGAALGEPRFSGRVVAFEPVDGVWIVSDGARLQVVQVTAHHCDELCGVLERVDADEGGVIPSSDEPESASADFGGPFEIPPELGFWAVTSGCGQAGVAACDTEWNARDEICDGAGGGTAGRG